MYVCTHSKDVPIVNSVILHVETHSYSFQYAMPCSVSFTRGDKCDVFQSGGWGEDLRWCIVACIQHQHLEAAFKGVEDECPPSINLASFCSLSFFTTCLRSRLLSWLYLSLSTLQFLKHNELFYVEVYIHLFLCGHRSMSDNCILMQSMFEVCPTP